MGLTNLKTYLKFLSRNKLYTFVSVLGFSVSLMFVIILTAYTRQEFSFDDFHENKDRIYMLESDKEIIWANPAGQYILDKMPQMEAFTRYFMYPQVVEKDKDNILLADVAYSDTDFFRIFSFELTRGNVADVLDLDGSVVISESMSERLFPGEDPLGRTLTIGEETHTITGVFRDFPFNTHFAPADFILNYRARLGNNSEDLENWNYLRFAIYFMAHPGVSPETGEVSMENLKKDSWYFRDQVDNLYFIPLKELHFHAALNSESRYRTSERTTITIYTVITILILIFAILNYVNTTVAQSMSRGKETAIRKLVGAGREGIVGQLLAESALMTSLSFLVGLALAFLAEPFFNRGLGTQLELAGQFSLPAVAVIIVSVLMLSVIAGTVPALLISKYQPIEIVKGSFSKKVKGSYSTVLGIFQYTICVILLICSLFILLQSRFLRNNDMGIDLDRAFYIETSGLGWVSRDQLSHVESAMRAVPGVENVAFSNGLPTAGVTRNGVNGTLVAFFAVDSAFLDILDIRITPRDHPAGGKDVYLNQLAYNIIQPDQTDGIIERHNGSYEFAGLVSDFNIYSLYEDMTPVWLEIDPENFYPYYILIKISDEADLLSTVRRIRDTYAQFIDGVPFTSAFIRDNMQAWYEKEWRAASIMWAFTIMTVLIMITGVFAMALYTVRQKEKEIGVRKVNGATTGEILGLLNRRTVLTVLVSFVIACPVAWFAMERWMRQFAYKIGLSAWVFVLCGVIVLALTVACVTWQSMRTARMNPVDTLKSE